MEIVNSGKLKKLIADTGRVLKAKDDNYEEAHIDETGNMVEEHFPYYFTIAYVPSNMALEQAMETYDEINENEKIESEETNNGSN